MENKRKKLNAVDAVIIVVLIIVVAFAAYKFVSGRMATDNEAASAVDVTYQVKAVNVDAEMAQKIDEYETPMQLIAGKALIDAYVTDIEIQAVETPMKFTNDTGTAIEIDLNANLVDVIFTVNARANVSDIIEVETQEIRLGRANTVKTMYYEMGGTVISMEIEEK